MSCIQLGPIAFSQLKTVPLDFQRSPASNGVLDQTVTELSYNVSMELSSLPPWQLRF